MFWTGMIERKNSSVSRDNYNLNGKIVDWHCGLLNSTCAMWQRLVPDIQSLGAEGQQSPVGVPGTI
jgi:hypothetical protein